MKSRQAETPPASVAARPKQAGEVRARWSWTEPSVWTDRMLTALESGVKGGKWFSLIDKVYAAKNLSAAYARVSANGGAAGVDHQTVKQFGARLDKELGRLGKSLSEGSCRPQAIRRVYIPKPGRPGEQRPLGIPTVRDRVVQTALRNVLEPIYEREFSERSFGFRPGRGCKDALREVDRLLKAGYVYVVDADLRSYFDSIPHDKLLERVGEHVSDGRVIHLVEQFLKQRILEEMTAWRPERGSPQGAVISPLLSNIYLNPLDHEMEQRGIEMVRYADDFVILCRTETEARHALRVVEQWVAANGLELHPDKTVVVDARRPGGFDFLGYHFERGYRWPARKSLKKMRDSIRAKTRRTNGQSLERIIAEVNGTTRGWFEYFKHSHYTTFPRLDGWIRMRLRSILRKRHKGKGRGRGRDHNRWPNAFFADRGLFSLEAAYRAACQSAQR